MKYALGLVVLVATLSFAGSDFSGGCGETFGIMGYTKVWFNMFGAENHDPANSFRGYNWTSFIGRLNENVYGCVGTQFKTWNGNTSIQVCDAFLNMKIIPELSIKAGQFRVPIGWAFNCSGGGIYFLDRAYYTTTTEFKNFSGRDIGVQLHGQFDMVGLDLGIYNGTGAYTDADTSTNKKIAALVTVDVTDWLTFAGGVSMIGQPVLHDTSGAVSQDEWSATAFDAYALVDYPLSETADLIFQGEFLQSGYAGPERIGGEWESAMAYNALLGVNIGIENSFLTGIMPAVRYESLSPYEFVEVGQDAAEDNITVMDFCLNCYITPKNNIQIGGRNFSYENENMDGHTDMYLGWRMNF
ncbi:MAG: hypothetical protein GQ565_02490 [Candidatus Aegiribacteria sp.]|nr:hypothetical protein [Candidatus Aegiribacteria sp.]